MESKDTKKSSRSKFSPNGDNGREATERIPVLKTYKLYINGQFPRTESGRFYQTLNKNGKPVANFCLASRKDVRDAVSAARSAVKGWSARAAFNRGQILYRIAEMLEDRRSQFAEELVKQQYSAAKAGLEVDRSLERLIYYAGWCDKYQQVFSSVNPVASSHFNFSVPEPTGVVALLADNQSALLGLVSMMAPVIAGGNTCVVLAGEQWPASAISFAEVLHTSDLPAGVVNILTGKASELAPVMASHMDINAMLFCGSDDLFKLAQDKGAENVKRVINYSGIDWYNNASQSPYFILDAQEIKTTWHPIEPVGGAGNKY